MKQLSVFVENKPGKILEMLKDLAEANISIRAMSIADTKEFGILRLIVSDTPRAKAVLSEQSVVVENDVVAVAMNDQAGALYEVMRVFGRAHINVDYMYAFTAPGEAGAYVVLRVDNNELAERVLRESGLQTLDRTI